jgi:DNA adenine methylase
MGGASLFFARDPAPVEVLNDLDGDLVHFFRCLQDPATFTELRHRLTYTLYAHAEFVRAIDILKRNEVAGPVERAWAFFVRQNSAFSGIPNPSPGQWARTFVSRGGRAMTTNRWMGRLATLDDWHRRLMRVQIDQRDALEVIKYWDTKDTVFYIDPPYHLDARASRDIYTHEVPREHHVALVDVLLGCKGAVVLSGYEHPVYGPLESAGWSVTRYSVACNAVGRTRVSGIQGPGSATARSPRIEVIWQNPAAVEMMRQSHGGLGVG